MIENIKNLILTGNTDNTILYFSFIAGILFVLVVLCFLWQNKIKKSNYSIKKDLTYTYDDIFYQLAKFQEKNKLSKVNLDAMSSLFELQNPSYISNFKAIKSKINFFEDSLSQNIISPDVFDEIKKETKKIKLNNFLKKLTDILICLFFCLIIALIIRVYFM